MKHQNYTYRHQMPAVTTDCVVFGYDKDEMKVLLIERGGEPFKGMWAIPGGFLNMNETAEEGARRELREETGLEVKDIKQLHCFSDPRRDPRGRTISIAFTASTELKAIKAGDDASKARWFTFDEIPALAFDHEDILRMAMETLPKKETETATGTETVSKMETKTAAGTDTKIETKMETTMETGTNNMTQNTLKLENMKNLLISEALGDIAGSVYEGPYHRTKDYNAVRIFMPRVRFTDDTVLTFACADAFLNGGDMTASLYKYANKHPYAGFGHGFRRWMKSDNPKPYGSSANGSAMRCSAAAWLAQTEEECIRMATETALPTHNSSEGIKGAVATALATFYLKNGHDKEFVRHNVLEKYYPSWADKSYADFHDGYRFTSSCRGSVGPAIICFLESKDYIDCIKLAIALGGDADALAAIAGPMAYAYYKEMPEDLVNQVLRILPSWMRDVNARFDEMCAQKASVGPKSPDSFEPELPDFDSFVPEEFNFAASVNDFESRELEEFDFAELNLDSIPELEDFNFATAVDDFENEDTPEPSATQNKYDVHSIIERFKSGEHLDFLFFWGHHEYHGEVTKACLSQWYPSEFVIDGITYRCAEQYMMAEKARLCQDESTLQRILAATDPRIIKQLGREVRGFSSGKWSAVKRDVVYRGNVAKFQQNPLLRDFLLSTGDKVIAEASPSDRNWGIGMRESEMGVQDPARWRGKNMLGEALMRVRDTLRNDR